MFGNRVKLFELFGFSVHLDTSWVVIALLVTWSLATGYLPDRFAGFSPLTYWIMGVIGAAGLFLSIVFHEFCHSLVARSYGMEMKGITLFLFGGIAEMGSEPSRPKVEFLMALAGPVSSIVLGFFFYGLLLLLTAAGLPPVFAGIFGYLAFINWLIAGFNLLPAFPLDGGRILRSALWQWKKDFLWSTHIVSWLGAGFGIVLMALGVVSFLAGFPIVGMWYFLIGLFLHRAARHSYRKMQKDNASDRPK
jgi:Zn-dependent protease